jgi:hypothetical protein
MEEEELNNMFASCSGSWNYYLFISHYAQQSLYEVQNIYTQVSDVKTILFTLHVSGEIPIIRSDHES